MAKSKIDHEYHEGQSANQQFKSAMKRIISVSRPEIERREREYQKQQASKPKRGPKPKASASRETGDA